MRRREHERELAELGMPGNLGGNGKAGYGYGGGYGYGLGMDQKAVHDVVWGRGRGFDGMVIGEVGVGGRGGVGVGEDGVLLGFREWESERTLLGRHEKDVKGETEFGVQEKIADNNGGVEGDNCEGDDTLVARRGKYDDHHWLEDGKREDES